MKFRGRLQQNALPSLGMNPPTGLESGDTGKAARTCARCRFLVAMHLASYSYSIDEPGCFLCRAGKRWPPEKPGLCKSRVPETEEQSLGP